MAEEFDSDTGEVVENDGAGLGGRFYREKPTGVMPPSIAKAVIATMISTSMAATASPPSTSS